MDNAAHHGNIFAKHGGITLMGTQIAIPEIIEKIHEGFKNAQNQYDEMSGGHWLWEAPEYLITVNVAQALSNCNGSHYITLENNTHAALYDAGGIGKGKLKKDIRHNGRMDILLWYADGSPRAIIEVKNQFSSNQMFLKDIKRIKSLLERDSTFQFGVFCFYDSAISGLKKDAKEKVQAKFDRVLENANDELGVGFETKLYQDGPFDVDSDSWGSCCIFIKRK